MKINIEKANEYWEKNYSTENNHKVFFKFDFLELLEKHLAELIEPEYCEWKYDEEFDLYDTQCKHEFCLVGDVTLGEALEIRHCCYCGKLIKEVTNE